MVMSLPASQKGRNVVYVCVCMCVNDRFTIRRSEKYQRPSVCNLKDILLLFTDIKFGFLARFSTVVYYIIYDVLDIFTGRVCI